VSDDALLSSLRTRVRDEVSRVVPAGPVALLDYPDYGNPGDSAIWLGALHCLESLGFAPPVYTSDQRTFDERMLRRALPSGTILLTGGGNLGDLWPRHQAFRERVISAFPEHTIVQLPQSIHFGDPAALAAARSTFSAHKHLTLLVRDARSVDIATSALGCRAVLCPDIAFAWQPVPNGGTAPTRDILRLLRTDHEAASDKARPASSVDWVDDVSTMPARVAHRLSAQLATMVNRDEPSMGGRSLRAVLSKLYPRVAEHRVSEASRLLRSARVVITDRLHGHILSLMLGVPHVVIGDRHGKLRGFHDTWTSTAAHMGWAETRDDAERLARELSS
jgi:exopolysaccharide biosynthesis predicted pyruvyltransferase EpsI